MGDRLLSDLQLHPNSLGPEAFLGGRDGFFRRSIVVPAWRLSLPEIGFEMDLPERCFVNKCVGGGAVPPLNLSVLLVIKSMVRQFGT